MSIENHTKRMYDQFGKEYQRTRDEKQKERAFNDFLELPEMIKAVGNIKGKKLLDIGCGAGIHIKKYLKKCAKCYGVDISKTMVDLARKNCPGTEFKVSTMTKLPYANNFFDITTASLSVHYLQNLEKAFKEVSRILKKGGLFLYSTDSPICLARQRYEDDKIKAYALGKIVLKESGKRINLGQAWHEEMTEFEMVPGMTIKAYQKTFRNQLQALRKAGFELVDFIDCKPVAEFKKVNPESYDLFMKIPGFSIYVARKR